MFTLLKKINGMFAELI